MERFLERVACCLLDRTSDHRNTTLIFPNKRSTLFMRRYLKRNARGPVFMPRLVTIGSFMSRFTPEAQQVNGMEALFTLYDAYVMVENEANQTPMAFDRFRYWGELMLSDFDDIDRRLVNAEKLLGNLSDLKEIRTDYLTEDQRQLAIELWGYDPVADFEGFWRHYARHDGEDVVFDGFKSLSLLMYPVYQRFHQLLAEQGLVTAGRIARNCVERIADALESDDSMPQHIAMIGFDILDTSRRKMFDELQKSGRCEFFWDIPDVLTRDTAPSIRNRALPLSRYISSLVKQFPMPADFGLPPLSPAPGVEIISVPSNTLQTKVAGNILDALHRAGDIDTSRADDTVVVMPDSALLVPMLHSLPPSLFKINVTMGMPVRNTPFATLLSSIITMRMLSRLEDGETVFPTENLSRILTHPSVNVIDPQGAAQLRRYIAQRSQYMTPYSEIVNYAPKLGFIFDTSGDENSSETARRYLDSLFVGMTTLIKENISAKADVTASHELKTLNALKTAVDTIFALLQKHREVTPDLDTGTATYFRLVERLINKEVLNLSGSPLRGVQIMGALETRSLDFTNVVMLSMNEKTFPPRRFVRSLIPAALRNAYGMTSVEEHELEYSWLFANIVSRSRRVYLLYNAAADEFGAGGMSRYLYHVRHIYSGLKARLVDVLPHSATTASVPIVVDKTNDAIRKQLARYMPGGDLNLSASALKNYLRCPLKFYLTNVEQISEAREIQPSIDVAMQGTIAHAALEALFKTYVVGLHGGVVDSTLDIPKNEISAEVARQFDSKYYFDRYHGNVDLMPGEARLLVRLLTDKIDKILRLERDRGPFNFFGAEVTPAFDGNHSKAFDWKISDKLTVRFTYSIDRIDRLSDGKLRFIDYKTGSDKLSVGKVDDLFHRGGQKKSNDAIFQLLTYAHAYNDFTGDNRPVRIEITKVFDPKNSVGPKLKIKDAEDKHYIPLETHLDESVEAFRPMLNELVEEIFDETKPFVQATDIDSCSYCQFLNVCHRVVPDKKY